MEIRDVRGVTSTLHASWIGIGCLLEGGVGHPNSHSTKRNSRRRCITSLFCENVVELKPVSDRFNRDFIRKQVECVLSSLTWEDLHVNPDLVVAFNFCSGTILDFDP
ncbi:hypothetical protein EVAR_46269_1 [Eumeta japonica]|uniref:Uncharacterized protein n=1 Tax=Eumeta variegata TaxID=151549 RepID=A0A4C1Y638_EUMVA|nr:hypothetical protein EVAR_46269_1 [Eumeta japonica]